MRRVPPHVGRHGGGVKLEPATVEAALAAATSFDEAARALNVASRSLRAFRRRHAITARPGRARPPLTRAAIVAALEKHRTAVEAARALGWSEGQLRRTARTMRVRVTAYRTPSRASVLDAMSRASSTSEAAHLLGMSVRGFQRAKRAAGLRERVMRRVSAARLMEALDAARDYPEAARLLGVSKRVLRDLLRQLRTRPALSTSRTAQETRR